jgi:hypothetical protein
MTEPFYLPVRIHFTISKILSAWKANGVNGDKCKPASFKSFGKQIICTVFLLLLPSPQQSLLLLLPGRCYEKNLYP